MLAAIIVAILSVLFGAPVNHHHHHVNPPAITRTVVNPATIAYQRCATEDSRGACYWDGGQNDKGRHFIVTSHQRVIYVKATGKWTAAQTVSNDIRNDLGITGEAVMLIGPDETVIVTATGDQYES